MLEIIPNGTTVKTKIKSIEAIVTARTIRGMPGSESIQYELSYFVDSQPINVWALECEFEITQTFLQKIGFKK